VTVGAVGSHHVLTTAYFGRRAGLTVEAALVAQPRTDHVAEVLRASLGLGLRAYACASRPAAILTALARSTGGGRFIAVGGSSVTGAMGYVEAGRELAAQVRSGQMPEPDVCVVALGSGGTAAGLAVGLFDAGLRTRVVGVCVAEPIWLVARSARWLVRGCERRIAGARRTTETTAPRGAAPLEPLSTAASGGGLSGERPRPRALRRQLTVDERFIGRGYGYETELGAEALTLGARVGLTLEQTYTAKAFACALWHVRARRARVILYWHTLSSAPLAPLLRSAPEEGDIDPHLRRLMRSA
jgi:D-cysteine desulfhydrase